MGIVKIGDDIHHELRITSKAMSRSINAQAEHWLRIGQLIENHPQMTYTDICQLMINQERHQGTDIEHTQHD
jgi:hypothetical protein